MASTMMAPTARQETLAGTGIHHIELCLGRSEEYHLAEGPWRFFCERPMQHRGQPHGATLDGRDLEWMGGA